MPPPIATPVAGQGYSRARSTRPSREPESVQSPEQIRPKGETMPDDSSARSGSPAEQGLPDSGFVFEKPNASLVVIDPQNDFLSPNGAGWPVFGQGVTENDTVANLGKLFEAAASVDMVVAVSPHYDYPADWEWKFGGPAEQLLKRLRMFERSGPLTVADLPGSGADFLEQFKRFILDGSTIIASPHKMWGPQSNDLALQLRKRGVSQIVLAGMAANLCVESHLRHLLEEGFEVVVVSDATAAPRVAAGDAYRAALTNYSFVANAVWATEEAVSHIRGEGGGAHPTGRDAGAAGAVLAGATTGVSHVA
jgi:nicotinamidase-related amidase